MTPVHPRACGEQTLQAARNVAAISVHPRACGEQWVEPAGHYHAVHPCPTSAGLVTWHDVGSSPRLRGTDADQQQSPRTIDHRNGSVHPRACGEQIRI